MPVMRKLLALLALAFAACATSTAPDVQQETAAVSQTVDAWHKAAADADEGRYFGLMTADAVFLGTDATERWNAAGFREFAHPYFAKGKAWTFVPHDRHVMISPAGDVAWFDEKLDSASYGDCRGSGVLEKTAGGWRIAHYNLTIPIPNALAKSVVQMIRQAK
jgi:ketosteroid isomerase-like protein